MGQDLDLDAPVGGGNAGVGAEGTLDGGGVGIILSKGIQPAISRIASMSQSLFLPAFLIHFLYSFSFLHGFPAFLSAQSQSSASSSSSFSVYRLSSSDKVDGSEFGCWFGCELPIILEGCFDGADVKGSGVGAGSFIEGLDVAG